MRTIEQTVYQFKELGDDAKKKVLERFRDINTDHHWYDFIFENFKEDNKFEVGEIYFSGFSSQGDGAMFEYSGYDWKSWVNGLLLPEWKKAVLLACEVSATGKHSGRYYHYNSCQHSFDWWLESNLDGYANLSAFVSEYMEKLEQHIENEYKSLCNELYRDLETGYDYLTSDKAIQESIEANEYEFLSDGTLYCN